MFEESSLRGAEQGKQGPEAVGLHISAVKATGRRMLTLVILSVLTGFHCILTWPKLNSQCWASSCEIFNRSQWYCLSIFRSVSLRLPRTGGEGVVLWYFAASRGPCRQGVDLVFTLPQ